MLRRLLQPAAKAWLIAFTALMLLGVQLVQNSPLHDHTREVIDCALCHLQALGDDTEVERSLPEPVLLAVAMVAADRIEAPRAGSTAPYYGRAPPLLLS